jgi:hypothetical protein
MQYDQSNVNVLWAQNLAPGDTVVFRPRLEYRVAKSHTFLVNQRGDQLFEHLGLYSERYALASEQYGYEAGGGDWPTGKYYADVDFAALTRLTVKLFELLDEHDQRKALETITASDPDLKAALDWMKTLPPNNKEPVYDPAFAPTTTET